MTRIGKSRLVRRLSGGLMLVQGVFGTNLGKTQIFTTIKLNSAKTKIGLGHSK